MTSERVGLQDTQLPKSESGLHFGHFAKAPEYREINWQLIRDLASRLPNPFCHVDIATGTGLVPQLVIEESEKAGLEGTIIGIDPNPISLEIARTTTPQARHIEVLFIEGYGQNAISLVAAKIPPEGVSSTSIHDAIHEIPGEATKRGVFEAMSRLLKPGGFLTYNSAFTSIAMREDPMGWGRWKSKALSILGQGRDKSVEAIKIHTPDEYKQMICDSGLVVIHEAEKPVTLTKRALWAISQYPAFITGVFRDMVDESLFSLEQKRDALVEALNALQRDGLSRIWHEIIAQKPPYSAAA